MPLSTNKALVKSFVSFKSICTETYVIQERTSSMSIFDTSTFAKDRFIMAVMERRASKQSHSSPYYFTTITGHVAYFTTPDAILPSNIFLISEVPFVPMTMRSAPSDSAYSTIAASTDI